MLLSAVFLICTAAHAAEYDYAPRIDSAFGLGGHFHYIHNPTFDVEWNAAINIYPHFDISGGICYPMPYIESFFSISKTFLSLRIHPILNSGVIGGNSSSFGFEPGINKDFGWMSLEFGMIMASNSEGKSIYMPNFSAVIYLFERFQKPEL